MKKNISINISGIIFHIEEDGYEKLKLYLESINNYFASFDDNQEIIADIESRIAEIFLSKLNEGKQVITFDDVESLKATMGSVKDFQAVEEPELESEEKATSESQKQEKRKSGGAKKLFRDSNRKILGGVSAGLAHYFGIDPLWVRLLIIILASGSGGLLVFGYIIMWIVVPESDELEEDSSLKKMYRNPQDKVFGGVASGMAAYFGVEAIVIRIAFVLLALFGGAGIFAYIILWIIVPEAKSITEKVQMEGDPVTLSNIESSIKKGLNVNEDDDENILVKIILFPFRLIGIILSGLGKALGPIFLFLVEAFRIIFGLVIVLTSFGLLLSFVIAVGVLLGLFAGGSLFGTHVWAGDFPLYLFSESFSIFATIVAFVAVSVPSIIFLILGVSIIAKRSILNTSTGWALFGIWILSLIGLSIAVPQTIYQFKEQGEYRETETYNLKGKTAILRLHETGFDSYDVTSLQLRGHDQENYKLVKEFESRGKNRKEAIENAKMVQYTVTLEDSIITFDSNISFKNKAQFRGQDLDMILYIPYNEPFIMNYDLRHIIRNTIYRHGYSVHDMDEDNRWIFTPAGLECITCEKEISRYDNQKSYNQDSHSRKYENSGFSEIEIGSAFETEIEFGEVYGIKLVGREDDIDKVEVMQEEQTLIFEYEDDNYRYDNLNRKNVKIKITTPELDAISVSGASKVYVSGFNSTKIEISQSGASFCSVDSDYEDIQASVSGASELILKGQGQELVVDISGASEVNAYNYKVRYAEVKASGLSEAKFYVTDQIILDASLVSEVKFRGGAELITNDD